MQNLNPGEFLQLTAEGRACGHYDLSLYYGLTFACACGGAHDLKPWMEVVSELPLFRFVVACPERLHLTVVKARTGTAEDPRRLDSEMGTRLEEPWEPVRGVEFPTGLLERQTEKPTSGEDEPSLNEQGHVLSGIKEAGKGGDEG